MKNAETKATNVKLPLVYLLSYGVPGLHPYFTSGRKTTKEHERTGIGQHRSF